LPPLVRKEPATTGRHLQAQVQNALDGESSVDAADIGVSREEGVVTAVAP
jgi:hypothetical protein